MRASLLRVAALAATVVFALLASSASFAQEPGPAHLPIVFGPPALPSPSPKITPTDAAPVGAASLSSLAVDASALDQRHSDVAFNAATGEYFAVWEHQYGGADFDIRASRITAAGAPIGPLLTVANSGATERNPAVAGDPTTGYMLVVWESVSATNQHSLSARLYNGAGTAMGSSVVVEADCSFDPSVDCSPAVVWNSARSEYLVVWADETDIDGMSLRARRLTSGAALVAPAYAIQPAWAVGKPAVAYDPAHDQYLVAWARSSMTSPLAWDLAGMRLDSTAAPVGSLITVSSATGDQIHPDVTVNTLGGEFFVVWEDWRGGVASVDIYGHRIEWTGSLIGGEFLASEETPKPRHRPVVAFKPAANEYNVVYELAYSASDFDVLRRLLRTSGTPSGAEVAVSSGGANEQRPALAAGAGKHYLVLWDDARSAATTGLDLYAAPDASAVFSGKVYNGETTSTAPLPGATVSLYASNDLGTLGTLIASTTSDATGSWELVAYNCGCDMLNIVETDPAGFVSVNAASLGGSVVGSNQIRFFWPLGAVNLGGNNFWDKPQPPTDGDPPGNWANASPAGWVNVRTVNATVQAEDPFSGLNPATAQVAWSTDAGATWSAWQAAACSGAAGSKAPQTLSATVAFGQDSGPANLNRVRFRVQDMAGNVGLSPAYVVAIDTVPPQNASNLTCPSHTLSTWSSQEFLTCQWAAGSDAGSGIAGYSYSWSHDAATIPDAYADGTAISVTSYALPEWKGWYFHVRAVDNAGNAAPALHAGPYWIDHNPPSSQVQPLASTQWMTAFAVSWSGDAGYGAPIVGYDIRVVDAQGTPADVLWQSNTAAGNATYTGKRGHTYAFYSRARDAAGNVEPWDSTPDRQTTVGGDVLAIVWHAPGNPALGVTVYRAGERVGLTDGAGRLTVPHSLKGDELLALRLVYEHPATKPLHGFNGAGNWDWRVYHTTFTFNGVGDPQVHRILDPDLAQNLTLIPERSLVGLHLVVTVDWDASAGYLAALAEGMRRASAFLYDAGDGQFFLDTVEIFDNRERFNESDAHVYAIRNYHANAHFGGIAVANLGHIHLAREENGGWAAGSGHRVLVHEIGHYALHLYDEYLDRKGAQPPVWLCATNGPALTSDDVRASIMNQHNQTTEFCSNVDPNHRHETNTQQDALNNGETTWATIVRHYRDTQQPPRWQIFTPEDRGAVMAGPNRLPMPGAMNVTIKNNADGACDPFRLRFTTGGAAPAGVAGVSVVVDRPSGFDVRQGEVEAGGYLDIYGARPGDTVTGWSANASIAGTFVARYAVTACPTGATAIPVAGTVAPYWIGASVAYQSGATVRVTVSATVLLASPPAVELQQHAAPAPVPVPMAYDAGKKAYVGQAALTTNRAPGGVVRVATRSGAGAEIVAYQFFYVHQLEAGQFDPNLFSTDGAFRLVLPESLRGQELVLTVSGGSPAGTPTGAQPLSSAYDVAADSTISTLPIPLPMPVHIAYLGDASAAALQATPTIHRWDEATSTWQPLPTTVSAQLRLASAETTRFGRFVLLVTGETDATSAYLPLVFRPR